MYLVNAIIADLTMYYIIFLFYFTVIFQKPSRKYHIALRASWIYRVGVLRDNDTSWAVSTCKAYMSIDYITV